MKRKILLLIAFAIGALGFHAHAQWTDYTSVITNPSFETDEAATTLTTSDANSEKTPTGWSLTYDTGNSNRYTQQWGTANSSTTIQGIGTSFSPSDDDKYFYLRENWHGSTTYALSQVISGNQLPAGYYKLSVKLATFASSATDYTLSVQEEGQSVVSKIVNTGTKEGWKDFTVAINKASAETSLTITASMKGGSGQSKHWCMLLDDFRLKLFTPTNATDMTDYVFNASVSSVSGWTDGRINSNQQYTGAPDNTYMDTWNDNRNQYQNVVLPAGSYMLKAATRSVETLSEGNIYALVGDNNNSTQIHKEGSSGNLLDNGWAWTRVPFTITEASTVKIGFYSECGSNKWAGADNFTLTYYTSEANRDAALVSEAKADATVWKTKLTTLRGAPQAALQSVIDKNDATVAEIEDAITVARNAVTPYENWLANKAFLEALAAVTTTNATKAASQKTQYIDPLIAEGDAATNAADLNTAIGKVKAAVANYVKKLTPADAENAPFDLTFLIQNPSFDNEYAGWTCNPNPNPGNDATQKAAHAMEYYQKSFDIYQQLTGMATGSYRLKVKAYQRPGWSADVVPAYVNAEDKADGTYGVNASIYVNGGNEASALIKNAASPMITAKINAGSESEVEVSETKYYIPNDMVSAVAYFNAGYYENEAEIVATTNTVKFGFRCSEGTGSGYWTIFDDFRLYYTGQLDLSTFAASLAAKVAEANGVKTTLTSKIPAAALDALQTAIDDNDNDDDAFEEEDQFTEAIGKIDAAIAVAQALETPYSAYSTLRSDIQALYDVAEFEDLVVDAHTTLGTALSTAATDVAAATTAEAINVVTTTLKAAGETYASNANPTGAARFNLTFMLTNPDLTSLWTGAWGVKPSGWGTEQTGGNFQVMQNNDADAEDGIHKVFMEYYYLNDNTTYDNSNFNVYTFATLPKGTYSMNCYAFAKEQNYTSGAANPQVYFYANNTQGSLVSSAKLTEQSLSFVNTDNQEVKIGLKPLAGNTYNWMGIGYVELYKVAPAEDVVLDENTAYTEVATAADVKLTRTIYEGWNTVILPFSMSAAEVTEVFGAGKLYKFDDADAGVLNFSEVSELNAHTPYLYKADEDKSISEQTISARTITVSTNDLKAAGTDYNLVGTYTPYAKNADANPIVVGADYVLGADNSFHKTTVKNALKAFRCYIQANEATPDGEARLRISVDGQATSIDTIDGAPVISDGVIYNLSGQRVSTPTRGIYIINGKKVFVK